MSYSTNEIPPEKSFQIRDTQFEIESNFSMDIRHETIHKSES